MKRHLRLNNQNFTTAIIALKKIFSTSFKKILQAETFKFPSDRIITFYGDYGKEKVQILFCAAE